MKKVLIVGYFRPYFPYGSARIPGLAKYLHEFGWQPIIVTPLETMPASDSRFRVVQTPYPGDVLSFWRNLLRTFVPVEKGESYTQKIKALLNISSRRSIIDRIQIWYQAVFAYPDAERKWYRPALSAARDFLRKEHADAVISVWPVTAHFVAKKLKAEFKTPWLADFPDPWSENHDYPYGRIRQWLDRKLELKTLKDADAMTAVGPSVAEKQNRLHQMRVETITHGFDLSTINDPARPLTEKFTITYTGTIYPDNKQNPEKILQALSALIEAGLIDRARTELRFFGKRLTWLENLIARYRLQQVAVQYGRISPQEAIARQQESQVLLLLGWEDPSEKGLCPFKTFEYLAARRPILITGGTKDEEVKKVIQKTGAGIAALDVREIEAALMLLYRDYIKLRAVPYRGIGSEVEKYSYREMARKFATILDSISGAKPRQ